MAATFVARDKPHYYQSCTDKDCPRARCRVWKEAFEEWYQPRYDEGFLDGIAAAAAAES